MLSVTPSVLTRTLRLGSLAVRNAHGRREKIPKRIVNDATCAEGRGMAMSHCRWKTYYGATSAHSVSLQRRPASPASPALPARSFLFPFRFPHPLPPVAGVAFLPLPRFAGEAGWGMLARLAFRF